MKSNRRHGTEALEAEQAALGAMMMAQSLNQNKHLIFALHELNKDDFTSRANRTIFIAITLLSKRKEPVDIILVAIELKQYNKLQECGNIPYLQALQDSCPSVQNIRSYINAIKAATLRRKLLELADSVIECEMTSDAQLAAIEETVKDLRRGNEADIKRRFKNVSI